MNAKRQSGQGWASIGIAALAAVMVIAGLMLAGGPMHARKERRDNDRYQDLGDLSAHIACLARQGDRVVMPTDLATTDECPGPAPLKDRHTGEDYRIEPLENGKYRLCAAFELPADGWRRNRDDDCLVEQLPLPTLVVPMAPSAPGSQVEGQ